MRYFSFTILVFVLFFLHIYNAAYGSGFSGVEIKVETNKQVYNPGDEVIVTVTPSYPLQGTVELTALKDLITQESFYHEVQTSSGSNTFKFKLPQDDQFYRYSIRVMAHSSNDNGPTDYFAGSFPVIYTKEGAQNVSIADLSIDKTSARPGESIHVKFKIDDGIGNTISWASSSIGLCFLSQDNPPDWVGITPQFLKEQGATAEDYGGCPLLYQFFQSTNGIFDLTIQVPPDLEQGKYKFNVWGRVFPTNDSLVYPFGKMPHKSVDIQIEGDPVSSNQEYFVQVVDHSISDNGIPSEISKNNFLTYGQNITFFGYQAGDISGGILGNPNIPELPGVTGSGKPAIAGIDVHIYILGPYGIVYDNKTKTDENGLFRMIFPVTKNLQPGIYEIYNEVARNGTTVQNPPSSNVEGFYITNSQKFTIEAEDKPYNVWFQSVNLNATHVTFSEETKSLSFDVKKLDGKFYNRHFFAGTSTGGIECPVITIESPLLTGPFTMQMNSRDIENCGYASGQETTVGPINEDGKITLVGTFVVPEFPFVLPVLLVSVVSVIAFYRIRIRK